MSHKDQYYQLQAMTSHFNLVGSVFKKVKNVKILDAFAFNVI